MELPFDPHIIMNLTLLTLLVIVAFAVIWVRDLLASVILYSIFSLLMALMYLVLEAPDVAITEAAVGAGVSTIIFLAALVFTGRDGGQAIRSKLVPLSVVGVVGLALVYSTIGMPEFGDAQAPVNQHVAPFYIEKTYDHMHIPNIVTGVLASYRAWDTYGEVTVVFTALVAVMLLLGTRPEKNARSTAQKEDGDA